MKKKIFEFIEFTHFDGYERCAVVKMENYHQEYYIHFLQSDEYLENGETSKLLNPRDNLKSVLMIDLASSAEKASRESFFTQTVYGFPQIEAVAKIIKIIDDFEMICKIDGLSENILVFLKKELIFKLVIKLNLKDRWN